MSLETLSNLAEPSHGSHVLGAAGTDTGSHGLGFLMATAQKHVKNH